MKIFVISSLSLFGALLFGQSQPLGGVAGPPPLQAPGVATAPPPAVSSDAVVAEVNGKKYTAAEMDKVIAMLPAQYQAAARAQPQMLSQVFLMQRLAEDAEKAGLDQREPYKDQLQLQRMQALSTIELSDMRNTMRVAEADEQKYYAENPDKFKEVKVRVIHIGFSPASAKPAADGARPLTETEARVKIDDVAKQLKEGADFGKLAHDVSDDKASAAKDGDFGVIGQSSAYPASLKQAVFALKQGEVSAPIKEGDGFYLIRAEEVKEKPFNETVMQIMDTLKQSQFQAWLKGLQGQYNVKIENPAYFSPRVPSPVPPSH
jgi:peptidyl-prolyl cis-trans isomerase C